jgi:hypothetical protein
MEQNKVYYELVKITNDIINNLDNKASYHIISDKWNHPCACSGAFLKLNRNFGSHILLLTNNK